MDDLKLDLIFSTVRTAMSVADVNKTVDQQKYATSHSERLRERYGPCRITQIRYTFVLKATRLLRLQTEILAKN